MPGSAFRLGYVPCAGHSVPMLGVRPSWVTLSFQTFVALPPPLDVTWLCAMAALPPLPPLRCDLAVRNGLPPPLPLGCLLACLCALLPCLSYPSKQTHPCSLLCSNVNVRSMPCHAYFLFDPPLFVAPISSFQARNLLVIDAPLFGYALS